MTKSWVEGYFVTDRSMNMKKIVWLVVAGVCTLSAFGKEKGKDGGKIPGDESVEVFAPNIKGCPYKKIRIPCIVNAGGLLIAAAEGRYEDEDQGKNDIIVSVSSNGGNTWSKPTIAAKSDGGSTLNNPCLIYDTATKQTVCMYQRYPAGQKERDISTLDLNDPKALRNFVIFSKNGRTWTKPVEVTKMTRHEDCATSCSGPNPGVLLTRGAHKGRLVVAFNEAVRFGAWHITAAYSDDHGVTWKMSSGRTQDGGINEVSSVETEDGGVLVVSRDQNCGGKKFVSRSEDGGDTWSAATTHEELPCPRCQNGLTRYSFSDDESRGSRGRILFSGPSGSGTQRVNGIVKMSYDDGKTWPVGKLVAPGYFAYSALCPLKPGYVGLLYEGPNDTIRFIKISIKWLTNGEDSGLKKK